MSSAHDWLSELAKEFQESPDTIAQDWRLDLASLIGKGLDCNGWSQRQLSEETGISQAIISRMINAGQNWTIESAVRVLFALGIRAGIKEHSVSNVGEALIGPTTIKFEERQTSGTKGRQDKKFKIAAIGTYETAYS